VQEQNEKVEVPKEEEHHEFETTFFNKDSTMTGFTPTTGLEGSPGIKLRDSFTSSQALNITRSLSLVPEPIRINFQIDPREKPLLDFIGHQATFG